MPSETQPCKTEECRVKMLKTMFSAVKGYPLLLEEIQPDPKNYNYDSANMRRPYAFKTLIATMLSVRTRDETTLQVVNDLWSVFSTPKALADAPLEKLEVLIRKSGTYRQKAKRIKETARIIHTRYHDEVPEDIDALLQLPGVGRKVANCVLVVSFNQPAIPVDTHVHRIANRVGWVATNTPEKTERALQKLFPKKYWTKINYTMVSFGKNICKPINPLCNKCLVSVHCPKLISIHLKKKKQGKKAK